jgi:O-antigen chain-terminating methyltransferase
MIQPLESPDIDTIIARIKAEAARRKTTFLSKESNGILRAQIRLFENETKAGANAAVVANQEEISPDSDGYYRLSDFLKLEGHSFISQAYKAILSRAPDSVGLRHFSENLLLGKMTKSDIMGRLRYSPEGRARGAKIKGLLLPFIISQSYHLPILGALFRFLAQLGNIGKVSRANSAIADRITALQQSTNDALMHLEKVLIPSIATSVAERIQSIECRLSDDAIERKFEKLQDRIYSKLDHIEKSLIPEAEKNLTQRIQLIESQLAEILFFAVHGYPKITDQADREFVGSVFAKIQNQFRGPSAEIKERLSLYLPYLRLATSQTGTNKVLDLGCGRCEWLELAKEAGAAPIGIENNPYNISACGASGFQIVAEDALSFLSAQADSSVALITAFHLIEHLPPYQIAYLLHASLRILMKGGIAIFETPNPKNILVGASDFYRDPTHTKPIFPDTLEFMGSLIGFSSSECFFCDFAAKRLVPIKEISYSRLEDYLSTPRDFAWIGIK